jgi:predicted RNA-binding protein (virulence factor B family)
MSEIGKLNQLEVLRAAEYGLFLDGQDLGDILLPKRYVSGAWGPGDVIEIFLMRDSEDRLVATTETPFAMVGEFACLRVASMTPVGAFLNWGLPKDLLVPFREQKIKMQEGRSYVVRLYLDPVSDRITATSKLDKFLDKTSGEYTEGQAVELMICDRTDLGFKSIVNGSHWGMLFHNNVFQPLERGQRLDGYIQQVREDGKLNLTLDKPGYEKVAGISGTILEHLERHGGFMPITEKSSPEEIYALFGVSKKTYKKAIGALYKSRKITFEDGGTKLMNAND